jgi:hypothetical protein
MKLAPWLSRCFPARGVSDPREIGQLCSLAEEYRRSDPGGLAEVGWVA